MESIEVCPLKNLKTSTKGENNLPHSKQRNLKQEYFFVQGYTEGCRDTAIVMAAGHGIVKGKAAILLASSGGNIISKL